MNEKRKEYMKKYRLDYEKKNKDKISLRKKEYYKKNKELINKRNNEWMKKNKKRFREYLKEYYSKEENKIRQRNNFNNWINGLTKEEYRKRKRKYENNRRNKDINFLIKKRLRLRVYQAFNSFSKTGKIKKSDEYGINYDKIVKHLKKTLPKDFNQNLYEIDHITPCYKFDFSKKEDIQKCFEASNHQWLEKNEHLKKTIQDIS